MRKSLLNMYHDLKESASTSDFPLLLGNVQHKALINAFRGVVSPWRQYVKTSDLADFKTADRIVLGESADLLEVPEGGGYTDHAIGEKRYQIQAYTYGREWSISRQAVINDDLQGLSDISARMGRGSARTLVKKIVAQLEANALAYDGSAIFRAANSGFTTLTADTTGIGVLNTAMVAIKNSTDPHSGEKLGIGNRFILLVPPALAMVAKWLQQATTVVGSTSSLGTNPLANTFDVVVEPFLNLTTRWYLMVDPAELHWCEVGFVNGQQEPDVLMKAASSVSVTGGGSDPYGYEFDDIRYKVRYDFGVKAAFYQAIYKGGNA